MTPQFPKKRQKNEQMGLLTTGIVKSPEAVSPAIKKAV